MSRWVWGIYKLLSSCPNACRRHLSWFFPINTAVSRCSSVHLLHRPPSHLKMSRPLPYQHRFHCPHCHQRLHPQSYRGPRFPNQQGRLYVSVRIVPFSCPFYSNQSQCHCTPPAGHWRWASAPPRPEELPSSEYDSSSDNDSRLLNTLTRIQMANTPRQQPARKVAGRRHKCVTAGCKHSCNQRCVRRMCVRCCKAQGGCSGVGKDHLVSPLTSITSVVPPGGEPSRPPSPMLSGSHEDLAGPSHIVAASPALEDRPHSPPPPLPSPAAVPAAHNIQPPQPTPARRRGPEPGDAPRQMSHMVEAFTDIRAREQQEEASRRAREIAKKEAQERVDHTIYAHIWVKVRSA